MRTEEITVQHRGEWSKHKVKYLGVVVDEDLKWKKHIYRKLEEMLYWVVTNAETQPTSSTAD